MARKAIIKSVTHRAETTTWDPEKALAEAQAEKAQFLQDNPQHRPYQKEIDTVLEKAGTSQNRMAVLAIMMEGKLIELSQELKTLNTILIKTAE